MHECEAWRAHRVVFHLRIFDENFSQRERIPFMNTVYMVSSSASDPPVILSKNDIPGASFAEKCGAYILVTM